MACSKGMLQLSQNSLQLQATLGFTQMNENYRAFAGLMADGFFELDSTLRYAYAEGHEAYYSDPQPELIGQSRIELMEAALGGSQQLAQHNRLLLAHLPIDAIIATIANDGEYRHTSITAKPLFDDENHFTGYIGCTADVTARVRDAQHVAHQASHDDLTGVVNRREFEARLGIKAALTVFY